jgi:F-type H+-transporting ATPase subunit b
MIDINATLFIQLANFLVLLVVLHFILFKPIRQIMGEREQRIGDALHDAKEAQKRLQELLEQYTASLADAKQNSTTTYNMLFQQGLDAQRAMITGERTAATSLLDKARAEIAIASNKAMVDLKKEAERLSQEITTKLLGRAV